MKSFLNKICFKFKAKWEQSKRTKSRFLQNHSKWLREEIDFSDIILDVTPSTYQNAKGRPTKSFRNSSYRTQFRKAKQLTENIDEDQLMKGTEIVMRSNGKKDSANIVEELVNSSP